MLKETYHPNAYLSSIKNVKRGLKARTQIITLLERHSAELKAIIRETEMHYGVILHHLKLLQLEGIVDRKSGKPSFWILTGAGQKRLLNSA
jgi:predicted Rossmann fold nucleotide-binding protein DprA/Smf involved in DNA uptake